MKLHDLRPAPGSRTERTRVGRGIAAGKGKTAGRGTKGQKARAGGSIPPWFEGGQTPLHVRIPKLRGFKNRFKLEYEIVNVGAIGAAAARGAFDATAQSGKGAKSKGGQLTVNQDILRAVGLVRSLDKPLKILGSGELSAPLFIVADAFTGSARTKIEAAGGTVSVLEVPTRPTKAIGVEGGGTDAAPAAPDVDEVTPSAVDELTPTTDDAAAPEEPVSATEAEAEAPAPAARRRTKASARSADSDTDTTTDSEAEAATTPDDAATSGDDA